ncbi:MAG TPA: hypothetical protein VEB21_18135, partial [Terriglobales bacterium]|nr:hypothetical protein [Terriglobales bacterium]
MTLPSLRARLIAGTVVWMVAALGTGGFALSGVFAAAVERTFEDRLQSLLHAVIAAVETSPAEPVKLARVVGDPRFDRVYSGWYWQVSDGQTRLRSRSLWDTVLEVDAEHLARQESFELIGPRGQRLHVVGRTLRYPSTPNPITVVVAGP